MEEAMYGKLMHPTHGTVAWEYLILKHDENKEEERVDVLVKQSTELLNRNILDKIISMEIRESSIEKNIFIKALNTEYEVEYSIHSETKESSSILGPAYEATISRYGVITDTFEYVLKPYIDTRLN